MTNRTRRVVVLALCLSILGCRSSLQPKLILATTTSVQNSELLSSLLPAFEHDTGIVVLVHAVGSGRALAMLEDGSAEIVMSHAPEAEQRIVVTRPEWSYRKVAYNRFVIVGPVSDPARIGNVRDAVEAFRAIADSQSRFVSRGDQSGTHEREETLWAAAGRKPPTERLLVSGAGMAQALRHANELDAYTLSDEATFWQLERNVALKPLVEGDLRLINTYAILHPRSGRTAERFARWLVSETGQAELARFSIAGRRAYEPWPEHCPAAEPRNLPCDVK